MIETMAMEEGKNSTASNNSSSRWNPTKEQISMLENLYKEGIRTPTAEQIQQITGKLREFGSIEGKNVFYWFQNHKARQRQKQKQQTFAYYTRLLKRSPQVLSVSPLVAPVPQPNIVVSPPVTCNSVVIFRPVYTPPQPGSLNFYSQAQAQYSAMFSPECSKMNTTTVFPTYNIASNKYAHSNNGCFNNHASVPDPEVGTVGCETLQLFPLHPTNPKSEKSESSLRSASSSLSPESSERAAEEGEETGGEQQFLYDFLGVLNG